MSKTIPLNGIFKVSSHQVSCDLSDEAVILNLKSGVYYGLNSVGAFVWGLLKKPKKLVEIRDAILAEYDVEVEDCERDLVRLLEELADHGLIEIEDASYQVKDAPF